MSETTPEYGNTERAGGTRFSSGKPGGWWYAPLYGLRLVAEVWQAGAAKYAPMDWRNGQSFSTLIDCAMRHSLAVVQYGPWARDEDYYAEDGTLVKGTNAYHAACAAWNWLALLTFMALGRTDLDDVTGWQSVTTAVKDENGYSFDNPPTGGPGKPPRVRKSGLDTMRETMKRAIEQGEKSDEHTSNSCMACDRAICRPLKPGTRGFGRPYQPVPRNPRGSGTPDGGQHAI